MMRQFDDNIPSRAFDNFQVNPFINLCWLTFYIWTGLIMRNTNVGHCSLWTSQRSCQDLFLLAKRRRNLLFQHLWRSQLSSRQQWTSSFLGILLSNQTQIVAWKLQPWPSAAVVPTSLYFSWAANEEDFRTDRCYLHLCVYIDNPLDVQQSSRLNRLAPAMSRHRRMHQHLDRTVMWVISRYVSVSCKQRFLYAEWCGCAWHLYPMLNSCCADLSNLLVWSKEPGFWMWAPGIQTSWKCTLNVFWVLMLNRQVWIDKPVIYRKNADMRRLRERSEGLPPLPEGDLHKD